MPPVPRSRACGNSSPTTSCSRRWTYSWQELPLRPRERTGAIVLAVALAIVVAIAHARYYLAYSFVASLVVWINLRPPRRQYGYVIAVAALLWGVRLVYHEPAGPTPDPPLEQLFYLT